MVEDWIHWSHYWYFFSLGWVRIWDDASFVDEYDVDSIWGCWDSKVVLSNNGLYRPHTKVFFAKAAMFMFIVGERDREHIDFI